VQQVLDDPEWSQWNNREIARRCQVDEKTVRNIRSGQNVTAEVRSEESFRKGRCHFGSPK